MEEKIHFYSERHVWRLVQQQTAKDLERIFGESTSQPALISSHTQSVEGNDIFHNEETLRLSEDVLHENQQIGNDLLAFTEDSDIDDTDSVHSYEYPCPGSSDDETQLSDEVSNDDNFIQDVTNWMIKYEMSRLARDELLRILIARTNVKFPKDSRTLLATPKSTNVTTLCQGQYWHSGFKNAVINFLEKRMHLEIFLAVVNVFINIDGAPIGSSTLNGLWPILCSDDITKEVDVIGIFFGEGKPTDPNEFLKAFVEEAVLLVNEGITFNNEHYDVRIKGLICDAPAKAYVLQVAGHSGYNSCTKCCINGEYCGNTVSFPGLYDIKRTDNDFKNFMYNFDYQKSLTCLTKIPHFGLVSRVPLDYMHLICLGVMRKMMQLWFSGPLNVRLRAADVDQLSNELLNFVKWISSDFNRKPRTLKCLKFWKATELRSFLLYFGPTILKKFLRKEVYEHFLELHVAITILASPTLASKRSNLFFAENLLHSFVSKFENLYGTSTISHNVHNLLHITDDVRKYGSLDNFGAFRFENFIGLLTRLVKKGENPLQQIHRQITVKKLSSKVQHKKEQKELILKNRHYNGTVPPDQFFSKQYQILHKDAFLISTTDKKNDCILLNDGTVVEALNFVTCRRGVPLLIGTKLNRLKSLYSYPMPSSDLCIIIVEKTEIVQSWPCSKIAAKLLKLPYKNEVRKFVVFPILHTTNVIKD